MANTMKKKTYEELIELWRDITVSARKSPRFGNARLFGRVIRELKARKRI